MRKIPLTQGRVALVDDEDYTKLIRYSWYAEPDGTTFYAIRRVSKHNKEDSTRLRMHNLIFPVPPGFKPDHIDRDGLNNQKYNLRICTNKENSRNQSPHVGATSKYKGVRWVKENRNWRATITVDGKTINLGTSRVERNAALAYNIAAIRYFGEFAYINTITAPIDRNQLMEKLILLEEGENDGKSTSS